ncbi:MAG: hypothetical protein JWO98_5337 [Frankiales bacterium]|nr:hypothetical protein [Frankiales bacterium]
MTTITIGGPSGIVFTGTNIAAGWIYDDKSLDSWYSLPSIVATLNKRPNAHGDYSPDQLFAEGAVLTTQGQYFGTSRADAVAAYSKITGLFNEGFMTTQTVEDELGVNSRAVFVKGVDITWGHDSHFSFTVSAVAPDPRRYGLTFSQTSGLPSGSSGLVWNLGTSPSGLFWDWGTPGQLGQLAYTNAGNATTYPVIAVGAGGAFSNGFRVTEIETGRELTYGAATNTNDVVTLSCRTHRARINGGDVTGMLASREWFDIPAHATRHYQLDTLGGTTGTPTFTLTSAPASM